MRASTIRGMTMTMDYESEEGREAPIVIVSFPSTFFPFPEIDDPREKRGELDDERQQ